MKRSEGGQPSLCSQLVAALGRLERVRWRDPTPESRKACGITRGNKDGNIQVQRPCARHRRGPAGRDHRRTTPIPRNARYACTTAGWNEGERMSS